MDSKKSSEKETEKFTPKDKKGVKYNSKVQGKNASGADPKFVDSGKKPFNSKFQDKKVDSKIKGSEGRRKKALFIEQIKEGKNVYKAFKNRKCKFRK